MSDITDKLQTLYTRLIDSRDGYEQAMENVQRATLNSLLAELKDRRIRNAAEIKKYLGDRGVEVDDDGSILASAHRTFLSLKTMMGNTDEAILDEVLRGENELREVYDTTIEPATSTDPEFDFLNTQYKELGDVIAKLEQRKAIAA